MMDEINFKNWLFHKNITKKVASDIVSRLKRVQKSYDDIDEEYAIDKFKRLLVSVKNNKSFLDSCANNKYAINTYIYAINKYKLFRKEFIN